MKGAGHYPSTVLSQYSINENAFVLTPNENQRVGCINIGIGTKKIKKVDFIKLDVDGHELDVLKSGEKFFQTNKPVIFIEIAPYLYPEFNYNCSELIAYIKELKYSFYSEDLKKISNINNYVKKITYGGSENFYLMNNYKT